MMRLKDRSRVVPDNFRYFHAETKHQTTGPDWWTWRDRIFEHRKSNELPLPANMMELAEDQLCRQLSPEWCDRSEADKNFVSTRLTWADIVQGATSYVKQLFSTKQPMVEQAEADRRARICAGCFLNVNPQGCGACQKMAEFVIGDVAAKSTPYDSELKACAVCACPNKATVWFHMELLEEHDTPQKQAMYPPEFCWRSKGSPNYLP